MEHTIDMQAKALGIILFNRSCWTYEAYYASCDVLPPKEAYDYRITLASIDIKKHF